MDPQIVNRDQNLLWPKFLLRVQDAVIECRGKGLSVAIFEGYRTPARQAWLYTRGRTSPGQVVTNAQPWDSWHNYGLAVDVVFKDDEDDWTWKGDYDAVERVFERHGLEKGPRFEHAHFELTGGLLTGIAKGLAQGVGVQRVWMEVDHAISK